MFASISQFNDIQREIFDDVFHSGMSSSAIVVVASHFAKHFKHDISIFLFNSLAKHIVVGAPTGCGKTIILELAIVELMIFAHQLNKMEDVKVIYGNFNSIKSNINFKRQLS